MKYAEYLDACKHFADDTAAWGGVRNDCYYLTGSGDTSPYWYESDDASKGGFSVEWAFHLSPEKIEQDAPQEFADRIVEAWRTCVENGADFDAHMDAISEAER